MNQLQAKVTYARGSRSPRHFVPLTNKPGEFVKLNKHDLSIDLKYQRNLNLHAVQRIADNWSWIACGTLIISLRHSTGKYFIVDGQHRWEASKLLNQVKELPCLVFELDQVQDEAIGFLAGNAERKSLRTVDRFPALLLTKDPAAIIINKLAKDANRQVGAPSDKFHVACIGRLTRCIQENESALLRIWPIIMDLCKDQPLDQFLIGGIWGVERRLKKGQSLSDKHWRDVIIRVGRQEIEQSIRNTAILMTQQRNERILVQGVLNAINKAVRNKLEVTL